MYIFWNQYIYHLSFWTSNYVKNITKISSNTLRHSGMFSWVQPFFLNMVNHISYVYAPFIHRYTGHECNQKKPNAIAFWIVILSEPWRPPTEQYLRSVSFTFYSALFVARVNPNASICFFLSTSPFLFSLSKG